MTRTESQMDPNIAILLAVRAWRGRMAENSADTNPEAYERHLAVFDNVDAMVRGELRAIGYSEGNEINKVLERQSDILANRMMNVLERVYRNSPLTGKASSHPYSNLDINWPQGSNVKPIR